jgi:ubiquinone/menaquinone biosynthesis C-methylase UbiE
METMKPIGDIYDKGTTAKYYETVGKNAESNEKSDAEKLLDNLIPQNLDGKIVLDLGCGNGRHSEVLCEKGATKVVAMDLSETMIEQAKARKNEKHLSQLELVRADMDNLPIANDKFDFIFSRFSLMYSGKMKQVVKNLSDALSSGGEILIETSVATIQDQEQPTDFCKSPIPLILTIGDKKVELKNFAYTMEEYVSAFEDAGLKVEIVEQFSADELSIAPEYDNRDKVKFSYGIFKAIKEKE